LRFYDQAAAMTSYVSTNAGSASYLVRTEDKNLGRTLFMKEGRGEIGVLARAVALVTSTKGEEALAGRQFLDVGANIGTTTVPAIMDHRFARAVALEPEPQSLLTLRLNLLLNGLEERATALGAAVSNHSGTSKLVVNPHRGGESWIATDDDRLERRDEDTGVVDVPTVTLDELAADGVFDPDDVGLLWIDAQAHEGHILEGASCLVERGVPVVFEWDPKALDQLGDRGKLQDAVAEHYTQFIDLRASHDTGGPAFEARPAKGLEDYAQPFLEPDGRNISDILVLRLDRATADDLDVKAELENRGALKLTGGRQTPAKADLVEELAGTDDDGGGTGRKARAAARRAQARRLRSRKQTVQARVRELLDETDGGAARGAPSALTKGEQHTVDGLALLELALGLLEQGLELPPTSSEARPRARPPQRAESAGARKSESGRQRSTTRKATGTTRSGRARKPKAAAARKSSASRKATESGTSTGSGES
jgi:FkbM family methyltransferase